MAFTMTALAAEAAGEKYADPDGMGAALNNVAWSSTSIMISIMIMAVAVAVVVAVVVVVVVAVVIVAVFC
jgi:hypothetical protein